MFPTVNTFTTFRLVPKLLNFRNNKWAASRPQIGNNFLRACRTLYIRSYRNSDEVMPTSILVWGKLDSHPISFIRCIRINFAWACALGMAHIKKLALLGGFRQIPSYLRARLEHCSQKLPDNLPSNREEHRRAYIYGQSIVWRKLDSHQTLCMLALQGIFAGNFRARNAPH